MLNAVTLNRLRNVKNTLESAAVMIDEIIAHPDSVPDFAGLKELVKDAVQILEQQTPTKPAAVYRSPNHVYDDQGNNLGPNCPRDR